MATSSEQPKVLHVTTIGMTLNTILWPTLVGLQDAGFEVVTASADDDHAASLARSGVRHVPLRHARREISPRDDARLAWELRRLFACETPDLVHLHTPKPALLGRIAALGLRPTRSVATVHGILAQRNDPLVKRTVWQSIERVGAAIGDQTIAINADDYEVLSGVPWVGSKVTMSENGIDTERYRPATDRQRIEIRNELGLTPDDVAIVFVGRLVNEKGLPELFEAFAKVRQSNPDARLIVVGPIDDDRSNGVTPQQVERARQSGVRFLGERDDCDRIMAGADIICLPSHREGLSTVLLEAAATGLPAVTTTARGCRDVVADGVTGFVVPVGDADRLAVSLTKLAGSAALRQQMGANARQLTEERFSQKAALERTIAVYRRLLGGAN